MDALHYLDPLFLVQTVGLIGITAIVFAESGLLIGFFFPGDSLLFTAGLLTSQGHINLPLLLIFCFIAAVIGDNVGYAAGNKLGSSLFTREDSRIFKKSYVEKTQAFYEKYGKKAIIMARFVPIVRTFAPTLAGAGNMHYRTFFIYNLIGGLAWTWSMLLLGYFLGTLFPALEKYLELVVIGIIFISVLPTLIEIYRSNKSK